ncbi:MAG: hypothetical protein HYS32_03255 [Candidatus Woesearchaeota archaeon]|nr:MAG: hypothetical protein HYS32_03255 [Candidatus Woesearchaeota archaeon]
MTTHDDQMNFFNVMSKKIKKDVECYAFGGNAMIFYGYKDDTKYIDLVFETEEDRKEFIRVIELEGFNQTGLIDIYTPEKLKDPYKPLMYKSGFVRLDLFLKQIFKALLSPKMKEDLFAIHDFKNGHRLRVKVLRKEHLVMLKAVTDRQNDFDDIRTIIEKEKYFDWQYFIDEVLWQYEQGNEWIVLDTEKMLRELKKYVFVEQKYLDQLYKVH